MFDHRKWVCVLCCCWLTGCATPASINKYYSRVDVNDGISVHEAKIIGKKKLLDTEEEKLNYQLVYPLLRNDRYSEKYPDYWFVEFTSKRISELSSYLVVINKRDGSIKYAGEYLPHQMPRLEWVFK